MSYIFVSSYYHIRNFNLCYKWDLLLESAIDVVLEVPVMSVWQYFPTHCFSFSKPCRVEEDKEGPVCPEEPKPWDPVLWPIP